jgi:hypothetical protein
VLVTDPASRQRIVSALEPVADEVRVAESFRRVLDVDCGPTVLVASLSSSPVLELEWLFELRRVRPDVHLFVLFPAGTATPARLRDLAAAGVDFFLLLGLPDERRQLQEQVRTRLAHTLAPDVFGPRSAVASRAGCMESWCARAAFRPLSVGPIDASYAARACSVCAHFCVDRRTVYNDAWHLGWGGPNVMIRAARLLHVASELEAGRVSARVLARRLAFPGRTSLVNFVTRQTGMTLRELQEVGAWRHAADRWAARSA